jgi:heptosyltransferase I
VRVLLTRLSALGDIVHTWPLAEALRAGVPDLVLGWVVERPFACLVEHHPAVTSVFTVATRRWRRAPLALSTRREVAATVAGLRAFSADLVIDTQGLAKSAVWGALARVRDRAGLHRSWRREPLAGAFYTRTVTPAATINHVVDLNLWLGTAAGVTSLSGVHPDGRFLLGRTPVPCPVPRGTVLVLPATGGSGKAWPEAAYAELAGRLASAGRPVLVAWGPGEDEVARRIAGHAGRGVQVAPPTSILELAELMASCSVIVGGDTGTVHLGASLGTPTVAVFLTTDPVRNGPRGRSVRVLSGAAGGARRGRARTAPQATVAVDEVAAAVAELATPSGDPIPRLA